MSTTLSITRSPAPAAPKPAWRRVLSALSVAGRHLPALRPPLSAAHRCAAIANQYKTAGRASEARAMREAAHALEGPAVRPAPAVPAASV
jgi:hypothetical protein